MALKFGWFTEGISTRRPTVWMSMTWRCCSGNGEDGEEARKKNIPCIYVFYANQVIDSWGLKTRASIWCCISEPSQEAVRTACCSRLPQSSAFEVRKPNRCEEHLVSPHFYAHGDFIFISKEVSCVWKGESNLCWGPYLSNSIRISFFLLMKMTEFTLNALTACDETFIATRGGNHKNNIS